MTIESRAHSVLKANKVAAFLVAYNAERHIEKVLNRIPAWVARLVHEIYIIDDHSTDKTVEVARGLEWPREYAPLKVFRTPYNQGYGGNQRLGYLYAIQREFDIVVLLHADGQYAPEALPDILAPYADGADAVFGSRFLNRFGALRGRMPFYKFVGNRILTGIQNFILGSKMSEMHSGYRSYRTSALKKVPFELNSLGFDFDADIIVQFVGAGLKIVEVPIPTFYGDEVCHVNGLQYAWKCLKTAAKFRLMQFEIFYDPKFDFRGPGNNLYVAKKATTSLHHFMRQLEFPFGAKILNVGEGNTGGTCWALESSDHLDETFDVVFALDALEHVKSPEVAAKELFGRLKSGGKLYASTGNIGFWVLRIMHLLGQFNYGRRGILDLTHTRLFTMSSFRRLLKNAGFKVERMYAFGPPLADLGDSRLLRFLDRLFFLLARFWPKLFAFQIAVECTRPDSVNDLLKQAFPETSFKQRQDLYVVAPSEMNEI